MCHIWDKYLITSAKLSKALCHGGVEVATPSAWASSDRYEQSFPARPKCHAVDIRHGDLEIVCYCSVPSPSGWIQYHD